MIKRPPLELPEEVARGFVEDMRAYSAEGDPLKRDEIAVRQLHILREHYPGKLRLTDVKQLFRLMRREE